MYKDDLIDMSEAHQSELPLLLPLGMAVPPNDKCTESPQDSECDDFEGILAPPERIILNDFTGREQCVSDPFVCDQGSTVDDPLVEDAEEALRTLLTKIIEELQFRNNGKQTITEEDADFLRDLPDVAKMFEDTVLLANIDVADLLSKGAQNSSCFLINLANLMWLHALLLTDEDNRRGVLFKNWPLRHIYLNSIGYNVGELGFVSLHDLHCILFNLPAVFRKKTLCKLIVISDPRIHFLVAQPNVFSPKIEVVNPDTFEKQLQESKNDYLRKYVIVKDMKLFIPIPLLLFLERVSYDRSTDLDSFKGINGAGRSEKLNILTEMLRSKSLPYEKLLSQDMYLIISTKFQIKFSHPVNEFYDVTTLTTTVLWSCRVHRSLYQCLKYHTNVVRSTMLDDHLSQFACACPDKSNEAACNNNTLLTMAKIFRPMINEFHFDSNYTQKNLRCLYTVLAFSGITRTQWADGHSSDELNDSRNVYKVIEKDFLRVPTSSICAKIKICLTVLVSEYDMHMKWPHWYDVYFADPNAVLIEIVEHKNATLACMWMTIEFKYRSNFSFSDEANEAFYSLLRDLEDTSYLKYAYAYTKDLPIENIVDSLLSSQCTIPRLLSIVSTILSINNLSESLKIKYYALLIGLNMISFIEREEQMYYYKIAYAPLLIAEQLILNRRLQVLKDVLEGVNSCMLSLPEKLQQQDSLSRCGIDELLKVYAEKALHFRKSTSSTNRKTVALEHASIFKEGDVFYPPEKIPKEEEWIPNNWAEVCSVCQKEFSVFTRRHHCRRCGRVICNGCSSQRLKLRSYASPQRICEPCYKFENQFGNSDDDSSLLSCSMGEEKKGKRPLWTLDMDPVVNERIRSQAIFDTAPDIELCFSLLELHTENNTVPRFLLVNAKIMLKILRQRLVCPANFDYPEVTHIVRSLLLAAKVYYAHLGDMQGARQCEELTNESVMLNQMAKSKFAPPQPNKPIRDVQDWKLIRNTLLEQQNWELALEISTKNGLECESIWYLWAMHELKSGDWPAAREKFVRSNLRKNVNMLNSVLEILNSSVDKDTPKGLAKFFLTSPKKATLLPEKVFEECLYYLKTYGSGDQLFDYLIENERTFEAVQTTFAKKISPKKFVKKVYIPYLESKEQTKILRYMEKVDATLIGWKDYAHEICVFCSGNKYFEALYETQLWLKDYYRAALSCTMFYKMGAKSYTELEKNRHHLVTAMEHFNMALNYIKLNESTKQKQVIDPRRMEKYAETVNLQIEVADSICKNISCAARQFDVVPTLFGADKERLDVITLIFDASDDLKEAFLFSTNIIRAYSMNTQIVYKAVALKLMGTGREGAITTLIKYIEENQREGEDAAALVDEICKEVIQAKPQKPDEFIDCISNNLLKFDMLIESGYLKSAYVLAVKMKQVDMVEKVLTEAKRLNKLSVERICRIKLQAMASQP